MRKRLQCTRCTHSGHTIPRSIISCTHKNFFSIVCAVLLFVCTHTQKMLQYNHYWQRQPPLWPATIFRKCSLASQLAPFEHRAPRKVYDWMTKAPTKRSICAAPSPLSLLPQYISTAHWKRKPKARSLFPAFAFHHVEGVHQVQPFDFLNGVRPHFSGLSSPV